MTPRTRQSIELGLTTAAGLSLAIGSPFPDQMPLQHMGTVLMALLLAHQIHRGIGSGQLRCLLGFVLLHAFAARWIYSYVPYDAWSQQVFGTTISGRFGFKRNHFDRLVHFGYGLLVTPFAATRMAGLTRGPRAARYFAVEFVAASSLMYEFFEWGLTLLLSPDDIESYNGQQGDVWDAHKDMLFAIVGSLAATVLVATRSRLREPA